MAVLEIRDLKKSFGSNKVIDGLSLTVPEHSIFGLIGQNGAGKTTTMKMILGLIRADGGSISVLGEETRFGQSRANRHIGYLPDVPEFYPYMRPMEYLRFSGEVAGLPRDTIRLRSEELLSLVGLSGVHKKIGSFSRGMKQRLGIAVALINEPRLLISDEPTSALDPVGRKEILDILTAVRGKTTVLFSTHVLSDVERICDRVAVLDQGQIVLTGTVQELKQMRRADRLHLSFFSAEDKEKWLSSADSFRIEQDHLSVTIITEEIEAAEKAVLAILLRESILPRKIEVEEPTLESLFLEVVS